MRKYLKFFGDSLWRDADKMTRILQLITVTIPNIGALIGYRQDFISGTTTLWVICLAILATFLIGVTSRAYNLEQSTISQLSIEVGNDERFKKTTFVNKNGQPLETTFVKGIAKVTGNVTVQDCEIFATKFERWNGVEYVEMPPYETIRLKWALDENECRAISPSAPAHFGIVSSNPNAGRFLISTNNLPAFKRENFKESGKYKISLVLIGKDTAEAKACAVVNWDGNWKNLSVSKDE